MTSTQQMGGKSPRFRSRLHWIEDETAASHRVNRATGALWRSRLVTTGAPRSTKKGTSSSLSRYDVLSGLGQSLVTVAAASPEPYDGRVARRRKGTRQAAARLVERFADVFRRGGRSNSAGTRNRARRRCTIVMLSPFLPRRTSLTRLGVPRIGTKSARVRPC